MKHLNQNGMGVLEVTIAAALGIMVIGGIYTALDNINRTVNMSQVRLDAVTLQDEMRLIFSKPENCLGTFTGKKFVYAGGSGTPWVSATNITSDSGDSQRTSQVISKQGNTNIVEYDVDNANLKGGTSKLYRILLDQYTPSTAPTSATDPNFFSGTARLTFTLQAKSSALTSTVKSKPFLLNVDLMRCSACPTAGANCETDCAGAASNDMKIKSCSTQVASAGGSSGSPPPTQEFDCSTLTGASPNPLGLTGCIWKTPGTYTITPPTGITEFTAYAIGGGGGAGARDQTWRSVGGGGGGGAIRTYTVTTGSITIVVGSGGVGHDNGWNLAGYGSCSAGCPAGNGGNSTLTYGGVVITGGGGRGGIGATYTAGPGGTGSGGTTNCSGGNAGYQGGTYFSNYGNPGSCGAPNFGLRFSAAGKYVTGGSNWKGFWGGGGGGATIYGSEGNDPWGCGSGGGELAIKPSGAIHGGDGCVVITW